MSNELMLDVGQANELKLAFRRANFTNADIKKMCEGTILAQLLKIMHGEAYMHTGNPIIDSDAAPKIPHFGWEIVEHQGLGMIEWDVANVELYLAPGQAEGFVEYELVKKHLSEKKVLNAAVLDYLLENPHMIPDSWKDMKGEGKFIDFPGTVYRDPKHGTLHIRYLSYTATQSDGSEWYGTASEVGGDNCNYNAMMPAAVLKS